MNILVYEHAVAGGDCGDVSPGARECFLREGAAMLRAVVADFAAASHLHVTTIRDRRLTRLDFDAARVIPVDSADDARTAMLDAARHADATLLIAPECGEILLRVAEDVVGAGGRLLSPSLAFVRAASDKQRTAECWHAAGVPAPRGMPLTAAGSLPRRFRYPAVLKPRDGAGSTDVCLIERWSADLVTPAGSVGWRLEEWHRGQAASVAVLQGPQTVVTLPACTQRLSEDGAFRYLGGQVPLPSELDRRARRLAEAAVRALPPTQGYIGVDLVLGPADDGRDDVAIEINPRHTTSYIGLRALSRVNLATALLDVVAGRPVELRFDATPLEFDADGSVRRMGTPVRRAEGGVGTPARRGRGREDSAHGTTGGHNH